MIESNENFLFFKVLLSIVLQGNKKKTAKPETNIEFYLIDFFIIFDQLNSNKILFEYFRNIFKSKTDDEIDSPYYRLEEKEQQYSDLQVT